VYGQRYFVSDPVATADINVATAGSALDLVAGSAAAAVPYFLEFLNINCGVNAAQIQKVTPVMRSTGGSGAGGSLGIRNVSPAGPAASSTWNYLVGTPGTLSGTPMWAEDWQQFGGFELDRRSDDAYLVPSGMTFAVNSPAVSAGFTMNVNGQILEIK
jgi:hypothetical protein